MYCSVWCIAPFELLKTLDDGLVGRLGNFFGRGRAQDDPSTMPIHAVSDAKLAAIRAALDCVSVEQINNALPSKIVTNECIREASAWPRDAETGGRFGFPGASLWLDDEEDEEEEEEEADDDVDYSAVGGDVELEHQVEKKKSVLGGHVMDVSSKSELEQAVHAKRNCVVFVSAGWCRKCKYIKRQYARVSEEFHDENQELSFLHLDAEANPNVASQLGVSDVPDFFLYRQGKEVACDIKTTSREKLAQSLLKAVQ